MRALVLLIAIGLVACRVEAGIGSPVAAKAEAIPLAVARSYFEDYAALCAADGGKLWGRSLKGPFLFVDPESREVVANEGDASGQLVAREGVFVGRLGNSDVVANTSIRWLGKSWTMVMWDDDFATNAARRRKMMMHEAFHRLQPELGLTPDGMPNEHLDTRDGRYWLQLEWNALEAALATPERATSAMADALAFRAARRAATPEAAENENALEVHEGLAEYTGARASGSSDAEVLGAGRARRGKDTGFVRSFAYVSGPLYGYLLDRTGADWRQSVTKKSDLGALLTERAKIIAPTAQASTLAEGWGGPSLAAAEDEREHKRAAQLAEWKTALVDGPVLVIDLSTTTSGSFDPRKMYAFAPSQIVYTSRTLVGPWGKLAVEGGAMLEDRARGLAMVSLATKRWTLQLEPGWALAPGARPGDQRIVRRP